MESQNLVASDDASILVIRSVFCFICYEVVFRLLVVFLPEQPKLSIKGLTAESFRTQLAINLICSMYATICSLTALYALVYDSAMFGIIQQLLNWDYESLFETIFVTKETTYCGLLVTLSVGYFSWDLYHYTEQPVFEFVMILHHLISIIIWPIAIYNGVAHFFLLFMMFTELSTPLIYVRWYLKVLYGKATLWLSATLIFVFAFTCIQLRKSKMLQLARILFQYNFQSHHLNHFVIVIIIF